MTDENRFLDDYGKIERYLDELANTTEYLTFDELLDRLEPGNLVIKTCKEDLRKLHKLRNLLTHARAAPVAIPTNWAIRRISQIAEALTAPKRAIAIASDKPVTCLDIDTLDRVVKIMFEQSYSQIPVMHEESLLSILTTNTITRWLAQPANNEIVILSDTTVGKVLQFAAPEDKQSFVLFRQDQTVIDVIEKFSQENREYPIEAILITAHGKDTEKILGIITAADLPKAYQSIVPID